MKDLFNEAFYRRSSAQIAALDARFDSRRFLAHALDDLASREVMARMQRTADAFNRALPISFAGQLDVLRRHIGEIGRAFVAIWPCAFVATYGLEQPALALPALREFTRHGSAEFAIRPFLLRDFAGTFAVLREWARDENEHVRRLASEGSRPRLPWGARLQSLVADPSPTLPLLTGLRADPALYVRKSVANHLNDIAKDHPEVVLDLVSGWDRADARTAWIVRHGLRTLVKQGHPRALALFGAGEAALVEATISATPRRIRLGDTLVVSAGLVSIAKKPQSLIVDYVVHYARESGREAEKVFKWKQLVLAPGEAVVLNKRQVIRDFTTRRHHAGRHRIELQVNGRRLAETSFVLAV